MSYFLNSINLENEFILTCKEKYFVDKKIDIEGIGIIDSETEGKEIDPDDDRFLKR